MRKLILLPFTGLMWFFVVALMTYLAINLWIIVFRLDLWLIILIEFIGILSLKIIFLIPTIINNLILERLYRYNKIITIIHSFIGLLAILSVLYFYNTYDINIVAAWDASWIKTLILLPLFLTYAWATFYTGVFPSYKLRQLYVKENSMIVKVGDKEYLI